jgi:hypothetical protein
MKESLDPFDLRLSEIPRLNGLNRPEFYQVVSHRNQERKYMSNFPDLKLYRKFLILAVMLAGIFVVSSARHVAAGTTCCDDCFSAGVPAWISAIAIRSRIGWFRHVKPPAIAIMQTVPIAAGSQSVPRFLRCKTSAWPQLFKKLRLSFASCIRF